MKKALVLMLCFTMFLFAACSIQVKTNATEAPEITESATASIMPTDIPTPSPTPEPTEEPTPSPTPSPTEEPTPKPTQDISAIKGMWYCTSDAHLSIKFKINGKADFYGSPAECTGYEYDGETDTGTVYLDDGGGPFPYDISISGGQLHMLGEIYSRSPIIGMWYCTTDTHLSIEFHADGTADFIGSPAECTGYEFDAGTMTGTIYLDDGGGPFPYDISISGGRLYVLEEPYRR